MYKNFMYIIMFTSKEIFQIVLLYNSVYAVSVLSPPQGVDKCKFVVFSPMAGCKRFELYGSVLHRSLLNQHLLDRPIGGVAGTIGKTKL